MMEFAVQKDIMDIKELANQIVLLIVLEEPVDQILFVE
jgi:hypothetical protein